MVSSRFCREMEGTKSVSRLYRTRLVALLWLAIGTLPCWSLQSLCSGRSRLEAEPGLAHTGWHDDQNNNHLVREGTNRFHLPSNDKFLHYHATRLPDSFHFHTTPYILACCMPDTMLPSWPSPESIAGHNILKAIIATSSNQGELGVVRGFHESLTLLWQKLITTWSWRWCSYWSIQTSRWFSKDQIRPWWSESQEKMPQHCWNGLKWKRHLSMCCCFVLPFTKELVDSWFIILSFPALAGL